MRNKLQTLGFAIASTALLGSVALADDTAPAIEVVAGGGVEDFVGDTMRDTSDVNGLWTLHANVEVQRFFAVEAGYIGTAANVDAPLADDSMTLIGSTFEAIGRVTPTPGYALQPYAFAGAAWRHYEMAGMDTSTAAAGIEDDDDLFQIPVGAGLSYRYGSFVGDARFTFRPSVGESLIQEADDDYATLNTWGVSAGVGYQF